MSLFKIILLVLFGYAIVQFIRMVMIVKKASRGGYNEPTATGKKEKDISNVARILDEKRLDEKEGKKNKK